MLWTIYHLNIENLGQRKHELAANLPGNRPLEAVEKMLLSPTCRWLITQDTYTNYKSLIGIKNPTRLQVT